ncbi:MAG: hypothetical protein ABFD82_12690 [Syntrophaceae bacterium]
MKMKNICRSSILLILVIAICLVSCTSSEDTVRVQRDVNTRNEIAAVEGQIRHIDQQIAELTQKRFLFRDEPLLVTDVDAKINKLKSEREMLVVKLTALYQSLNK